ncbi:MAG: tetratricopeptide repeat protein [Verrucomicrobiota bacterium]
MIGQQSSSNVPVGAGWWKQHWQVAGICLVLAAITFAVFGQTAGFEFVNYDDGFYVYHNAKVAGGLSMKGLAWVFTHADCHLYHPLTMLSLMADCQLHGLRAGGYHFTNALLHTASAILLFLVLRQMTGAQWRSAFVAAVFAIHPLRVESVAWVTERKDVLSAFFFMLTLGAYARYAQKPGSLARYLMVVVAYVPALLSKPTVVTLPFVLLLLDYWPLRRFESCKFSRLVLEKIPLLALAGGVCAMTVMAAGKEVAGYANVSIPSRLDNALVSYAVYLRQMVWPEGLAVFYPRLEKGYPVWTIALSFLLLGLITGGVLAFQRKRRWLLVGWLWYLGMLTPMIGLVQAGAFAHADRMTYLPQIGIYVALAWLAAEWSAKLAGRVAVCVLMTTVLGVLMICAGKQTAYWQNSETLWSHTLACTTGNYMAHYNLGVDLAENGLEAEAISHYLKVVQIKPDHAEARNNLGGVYFRQGRVDEAISEYQKAVQIEPDYEVAHYNLATALLQEGRTAEAVSHYQRALQIEPANASIKNSLAWLLATYSEASLRDGKRAVELASQANELSGGENPAILRTLAAALAETGRYGEAVETAQRALDLAGAQSKTGLAGQLQSEIKLYEAGKPIRGQDGTTTKPINR